MTDSLPTHPASTTPDTLELRRKAEAMIASKAAFMAMPTEERMIGRPDWWVDYRAFADALTPEVCIALLDRLDALEGRAEGLESELQEAVAVAYRRGAHDWAARNYPQWIEWLRMLSTTLADEGRDQ